jgi:DNA-binding response OmpR family regulator
MLKLIYLIEDDNLISNIIKELLVKEGYSVKIFNTIQSLISSINQETPDLLIMDINFPEGKHAGMQFLYYLKKQIPSIVITANSNTYTRTESEMNGVKFYLSKPLNPKDIIWYTNMALN